jgi:hypothetical protein
MRIELVEKPSLIFIEFSWILESTVVSHMMVKGVSHEIAEAIRERPDYIPVNEVLSCNAYFPSTRHNYRPMAKSSQL